MDTNIRPILGHNIDATTLSPEEMINHAMRADTLPRETRVLAQLLSHAELCLQFIGGDRSQQGKMQHTTPAQILAAASSQSFQVEPLPGLNALRLRFDDDYLYGIHLPKSSPINFDETLKALELESLRSAVIAIENSRRMGFGRAAKDLSFLTTPLKNAALEMVLSRCNVARGIFARDDIRFIPSSAQDVLDLSPHHSYTVSGDPHSARFNIMMGETIYPCTLKEEGDIPLWEVMFQALKSEAELNHAYIRESDPEVARLRERMKQVTFDIPGLLESSETPAPTQTEDTTSVVPFRRR